MKEFELRPHILSANIKPASKVIMQVIIDRVDWKTWRGKVTQLYLSEYCKISKSTVSRSLTELEDINWITRHTERVGAKNSPTLITVNVREISCSQNDTMHDVKMTIVKMTPCQNDTMHDVKMTTPYSQNDTMHDVKMTNKTIDNNIIQYNNNTDQAIGGKDYYRDLYLKLYKVDIEMPANYMNMSQLSLDTVMQHEPTWESLDSYESKALHYELVRRVKWLGFSAGQHANEFIKAEKNREVVS